MLFPRLAALSSVEFKRETEKMKKGQGQCLLDALNVSVAVEVSPL